MNMPRYFVFFLDGGAFVDFSRGVKAAFVTIEILLTSAFAPVCMSPAAAYRACFYCLVATAANQRDLGIVAANGRCSGRFAALSWTTMALPPDTVDCYGD